MKSDIRVPIADGQEMVRTGCVPTPGAYPWLRPLRVALVTTTLDQGGSAAGALRGGAGGSLLEDAGPGLRVEAPRGPAG